MLKLVVLNSASWRLLTCSEVGEVGCILWAVHRKPCRFLALTRCFETQNCWSFAPWTWLAALPALQLYNAMAYVHRTFSLLVPQAWDKLLEKFCSTVNFIWPLSKFVIPGENFSRPTIPRQNSQPVQGCCTGVWCEAGMIPTNDTELFIRSIHALRIKSRNYWMNDRQWLVT